jgi:hypothetical protein
MASLVSVASLASIGTTTTTALPGASTAGSPDAGTTEFQTRRRRAAKLTQFFGVDYRDLIEDVLESIEHGLDAERRRGTLNPAQAEVSGLFLLSSVFLLLCFHVSFFLCEDWCTDEILFL